MSWKCVIEFIYGNEVSLLEGMRFKIINWDSFPKLEMNNEPFRNIVRMNNLENTLADMWFSVTTGKDVVDIIEQNHLDLSQFDFPYDSFEVFKEHALSGEFDVDVSKILSSREEIDKMHKRIKDKKLWVRY